MARTEQEERNLTLVRNLYEQMLFPLDSSRVDDFIAADYIQHSSLAEPGREALKAWLDARRADSPQSRQILHRMLADGDHVVAHIELYRWPGDRGMAVMDMYRIANDRVAEHWEVIQEIPEHPINSNSMF